MKNEDQLLTIIEMYETYFGGKELDKHRNERTKNGFVDKTSIVGWNKEMVIL